VHAGVAPWQFYGPTTRRGADTVYLHMVGWPQETTSLRGVPTRRVRAVTLLDTGAALPFRGVFDAGDSSAEDAIGELVIDVPPVRPDGPLPVIRVDFNGKA
jgi:alpha-L-fucosidase